MAPRPRHGEWVSRRTRWLRTPAKYAVVISRKRVGYRRSGTFPMHAGKTRFVVSQLQARRAVHATPTWGSVRAKSLCRKYFIFRNWRAELFRQAQVPEQVEGLCNAANVNPPPTAGSRSAPLYLRRCAGSLAYLHVRGFRGGEGFFYQYRRSDWAGHGELYFAQHRRSASAEYTVSYHST